MTDNASSGSDRLRLSELNGATLKWEDSDGNIHSVEFEDHRSRDTDGDNGGES